MLVTIVLTIANVLLTYSNLRHNKKKSLHDEINQIKLQAYKELNAACFKAIKRLRIDSSPFVEIYDYELKEDWIKYCEQHMEKQADESYELESLIYEYAMILPTSTMMKYRDFANQCILFVTMAYYFDTETIINNQEKLWHLYIDLMDEFRKDLNIEKIDDSLRKRKTSAV